MHLTIEQQDQISASAAAACKTVGQDNWKLNPHPPGTAEHEIWLAGYEREAEAIGSQAKDW